MKPLTDTEKQQLDAKIREEQERQRVIRMNPNTPKAAPEVDFIFNSFYKYGMLAVILCMLVISVMPLLKWHDFAYDEYGGLVIGLMLLFNHIAFSFTTKGWKSRVMKTVARVWLAFGFVYILWIFLK